MKICRISYPDSLSRALVSVFSILAMMAAPALATSLDFSTDWRFHLGDQPGAESPAFADDSWVPVTLPHTARIEALVTNPREKQQWEGICWYRKTFTLPPEAAGQVVHLRFEGAMNLAEVFINGVKRGENIDGYTPFVVNLSDLAVGAVPVTVAVRLDNRHSDLTGPKPLPSLDFHLYHGLYRPVSLVILPPLHITDEILENKPASGGVFITYPQVSREAATIATQVQVRNRASREMVFALVATLRDLAGRSLAHQEVRDLRLAAGADETVTSRLEVRNPRLWSPQTPTLHYLDVELMSPEGTIIDSRRTRIGIRRFSVEPGTITINGEKLFLRGVNRHQEYPYVGNALPANAQYRDAVLIKQAGFDFVRLSHYPHGVEFMDACDELGLVVLNSILGWQYYPGTIAFEDNRMQAARALVRRDRNHASAILWELALNETKIPASLIARFQAAGHEEFPGDQMLTAGWQTGYDIKFSARQHGSTREFQNAAFPCLVSEYGDWEYYAGNAGLAQDKWQDLQKAGRNSRQLRGDGEVRLLQQATNIQEAHNENLGTRAFADAYWVMFDYNRGYADDLEASGTMDIFRLPKFSYYFFQSQRDADEVYPGITGGPMVRVATWWTKDSPLAVRVFSNCEEVELWHNGRSFGRQRPDRDRISTHLPHPPFTFRVPAFEPGELKAVAYRAGQPVAEDVVRTPMAASGLKLNPNLAGRPFATGGDLCFVHASIVDRAGTTVADCRDSVRFEVDGDASLLGDNPAAVEAGVATILLKSGKQPGVVRLRAQAAAGTAALAIPVQ